MNRFSTTIKIMIFILLVGGTVYAFNRLEFFKKQTTILTMQKTDLFEEKEYLEQTLEKAKKENTEKSVKVNLLLKELAGLQDTKRIKKEFELNQEQLRSIKTKYSLAKQENLKMNQSNLSLNHRLAKLTDEFSKTLQDVSRLQAKVNEAKGDKFVRKYVLRLKKTKAILQKREKELADLKGKNKVLFSDNKGFNNEKKRLEKNIMRLEKENSRLETLVNKIESEFNKQQRTETKLKEDISDLTAKLKASETEKADFDERIKKIELERNNVALELKQAQEKMKNQEMVITRLEAAQKGISVNEIPFAKSGTTTEIQGDLSKAYALYDTAKAQVVKFSEMLMSKEIELETSKKRIAALEEDLKMLRLQPEVSGDKKYALLHDRIQMLNEALLAKDSILQEKEAEVSALQQAKSTIEQRLEYQEIEYKNANVLYANLKSQLLQSTELLARRESEVIANNKELLDLKSKLILVQAEFRIKEQELKDLRMQQKKTLEDLSRVTNLNINLQQSRQGHSSGESFSQEDKQKADNLKRELEELMGK